MPSTEHGSGTRVERVTPPWKLVKRWRKQGSSKSVREFASWWETETFRRRMETPRGVQTRYSLVRTGLPYSIQTRIDSFRQSPQTGKIRGPNSDHLLPKQSDKAGSIVSSGKRFSSKKVHRRDETTRGRALFPSILGSKEVGGGGGDW